MDIKIIAVVLLKMLISVQAESLDKNKKLIKFIEPNKATIMIDPVEEEDSPTSPASPVPNIAFFQHNIPNPQIQTLSKPKRVKSNVQYIAQVPLKMQTALIETCGSPSAIPEYAADSFSLQPAPRNKKSQNKEMESVKVVPSPSTSSNNSRLPKPPLTPLVIPPTPVRSSSSPNLTLATPSRTSSMNHLDTQMTPGSSTPGSSRSAYSPHGLSPFSSSPITPSSNTLLPTPMISSPLSNDVNGASLKVNPSQHKKHSIQPDNPAERLVHQAIKYHESGKLEKATEMFKEAAAMDLPIAMFLYGVSVRHGWVKKKKEKKGWVILTVGIIGL